MLIAAFGDSLVAGYGVAPGDAFPARLEKAMNAQGLNVKIINDGVSGDTTAGGLARVDYVVKQKPVLVVIVLGGNDLLRGLPPEDVRRNLAAIMEHFAQAGIKMVVAGQMAPLSLGTKYANAYNAVFCDLAKQYNAGCYPFFLDGVYNHPELMQADGIHPNAQGAAFIADKIKPLVSAQLKR